MSDRRDVLSEQFDAMEAGEDTAKVVETVIPELDEGRARDESGKFVSREPSPKTETAKEPELPLGEPVVAAPAVEPPVWDRAPASWKKDKHELWAAMSPAQKEYAYQREEQMKAGVEPLLPKAQLADRISQAAEPYMNTIRGLGVDLPTAVKGLMEADHQLRSLPYEQKVQYAAKVLRSYGLDLGQLQGLPPQDGQTPMDPRYNAVQNELVGLKGQLTAFQEAQQRQEEIRVQADIKNFSKDKPYFELLRPHMSVLLQEAGAKQENLSLQDAYDQALSKFDELAEAQRIAAQAKTTAEKRDTANRAAQAAKAAAVSVKGSTPGKQTATNAKTRREILSESFDNVDARV